MRKPKLKKYPKKPKKTASLAVKENWLRKTTEIDKENRQKESDYKKSHEKSKQIDKKIQTKKR